MIMRVLFAAILAGFVAGLAMTTIQSLKTTPLILKAEVFEGANVHEHAPGENTVEHKQQEAANATAEVESQTWTPTDGFERTAYSFLSGIIVAIGFALILISASLLTNISITPANGAFWGFVAFAIFTLIPASGLPPELPAMDAAPLPFRQTWWWAAVAAGAAGVALIALRGGVLFSIIGIAIIIAPHIIGAPQPESHDTAIPAYLVQSYVANSILSMAVTWVVVGVALGFTMKSQKLVETQNNA